MAQKKKNRNERQGKRNDENLHKLNLLNVYIDGFNWKFVGSLYKDRTDNIAFSLGKTDMYAANLRSTLRQNGIAVDRGELNRRELLELIHDYGISVSTLLPAQKKWYWSHKYKGLCEICHQKLVSGRGNFHHWEYGHDRQPDWYRYVSYIHVKCHKKIHGIGGDNND